MYKSLLIPLAVLLYMVPLTVVDIAFAKEEMKVVREEVQTVKLGFETSPGWKMHWTEPGEEGFPTGIEWVLPDGVEVLAVTIPPDQPFDGYSGEFVFYVTFLVSESFEGGTVKGEVFWLVCGTSCIPGSTEIEIRLVTE